MEERIYLKDLPCFKKATQNQLKHHAVQEDRYFDLMLLPNQNMREEVQKFILERGSRMSVISVAQEINAYNQLCEFINAKEKGLSSFREIPFEKMERSLKVWITQSGKKLTYATKSKIYLEKAPTDAAVIVYLRKLYHFLAPEDTRPENEKDIWDLTKMGFEVRQNPISRVKTINFKRITQSALCEETKKAIYMELQCRAVNTVLAELCAINRFSAFLSKDYPCIVSLKDIDRDIIENYLVYLNTVVEKKSFRTELKHLNKVFYLISIVLDCPELSDVILPCDGGKECRALYKTYSDDEITRLNQYIVQMDPQIARALIIHEKLATRISDTLTLRQDCLYKKDSEDIIKIHCVKTGNFYEKPVDDDTVALIEASIAYTRERYGEGTYIFVSEKHPDQPYQYSMIQYQVMSLIREYDLRDDHGKLFGFNTHMFRHTYGRKLAEMGVDDQIIAKLLGQKGTSNVNNYRQLGDQAKERETRTMRKNTDEKLKNVFERWEKNKDGKI